MIKRSFCLGSEWIYYKIYTGVNVSDIILNEILHPQVSSLIEDNVISNWFFIRYNVPDNHIRIRFKCLNSEKTSVIINKLFPVFDKLLESDIIWKLEIDTYQREIERYGERTIIDSEIIFFHDSEMILNYISLKSYYEKDESQILFSLLAIDSFLNSFSLTISEKLILLDKLQESFKKEFNASKQLRKEFDKSYRELSPEINSILTYKVDSAYKNFFTVIKKKEIEVSKIAINVKQNIQIPLNSFLSSHIHMMVNRQYTSKQRNYECLIYDHLFRYYKMISYKTKFIT